MSARDFLFPAAALVAGVAIALPASVLWVTSSQPARPAQPSAPPPVVRPAGGGKVLHAGIRDEELEELQARVMELTSERNLLASQATERAGRLEAVEAELAEARQTLEAMQPVPPPGGGQVVDLLGDEGERDLNAEQERRRAWEERLARRNEASVVRLTETLELTAMQAEELRAVLRDELRERSTILDAYARGALNGEEFRRRVVDNREHARERLSTLLEGAQWEAYRQLPPTQQVLTSGLVREE